MVLGYFRWSLLCYLLSVLSAKAMSRTECTFKESFCGWESTEDSWERINADNKSEAKLPSTRSNSDAYYIAIRSPTGSAKITSAELPAGRACVSLWYYLPKGKNRMNIYDSSSSSRQINLHNKGTDMWKHISINVNPSSFYKVVVEGLVKPNSGYIAVDDTLITTGTTCSADCNFDDGWCAWTPEDKAREWIRHRSSSDDGGPVSDHTSGDGYYILNKNIGTMARLSVLQVGDGDICMTMWYYIHGDNSINIYVKTHAEIERLEYTVNREDGEDKWTRVQIQFFQQNAYEMIIEGVIADDSTGDISIDDVTVRQGVCEDEEDERTNSMVLLYVVVPLSIVAVILIGVTAYFIWRKRRAIGKSYPGKTQQLQEESNFHSSPSFSNNAYIGYSPSNQMRSLSDDSNYAVIGNDTINLSTDKAEYNVLNTKSKDQHERQFGYDRLKQPLTPFVDKSYSHVSHSNEDIVEQNCEKESNDGSASIVITPNNKSIVPKFPFETEDDLDIDYDHAQSGVADSRRSDDYSHLHSERGINPITIK